MQLAFAAMLGTCAVKLVWLTVPITMIFFIVGYPTIACAIAGSMFVIYGNFKAYALASLALGVFCPYSVFFLPLAVMTSGTSAIAARATVVFTAILFKIAGLDTDGPVHSATLKRSL